MDILTLDTVFTNKNLTSSQKIWWYEFSKKFAINKEMEIDTKSYKDILGLSRTGAEKILHALDDAQLIEWGRMGKTKPQGDFWGKNTIKMLPVTPIKYDLFLSDANIQGNTIINLLECALSPSSKVILYRLIRYAGFGEKKELSVSMYEPILGIKRCAAERILCMLDDEGLIKWYRGEQAYMECAGTFLPDSNHIELPEETRLVKAIKRVAVWN